MKLGYYGSMAAVSIEAVLIFVTGFLWLTVYYSNRVVEMIRTEIQTRDYVSIKNSGSPKYKAGDLEHAEYVLYVFKMGAMSGMILTALGALGLYVFVPSPAREEVGRRR